MTVQPIRLSPGAVVVLGAVLAAVQVVQQLALDIPQRWHIVILVGVTVLGAFGATVAGAAALATMLPPAVSSVIATLAVVANAVVAAVPATDTLHAVVGAILAFLVTIGFKPVPPPAPPTARAG